MLRVAIASILKFRWTSYNVTIEDFNYQYESSIVEEKKIPLLLLFISWI